MKVDVLLVGQGLSGTLLSWFLYREGRSFLLVDDAGPASSRVAAGIMNPVTGRRYHTTWLDEEVLPFADATYTAIGELLQAPLVQQLDLIDFFPNVDMRDGFIYRLQTDNPYLHSYPDQNHFNQYFHYDFGCGGIKPVYMVQAGVMLEGWRKFLQEKNFLLEERFASDEMEVLKDGVRYRGIEAGKIIFCEGFSGMDNPWFNRLPFGLNKGEALVIEVEGLPASHIYKKGLLMAPLAQPGHFWVGSNHQWDFTDAEPSTAYRKHTEAHLAKWLKIPFRTVDHKAAIRPATVERRPFVGFHPQFPSIGILNGMGSKGTSLAPFFANQLVQQMVHGFPITPEADVRRFTRVLSK